MTLRPTREGLLVVRGFYFRYKDPKADFKVPRQYETWEIFVSPTMKALLAQKVGRRGEATPLMFEEDKLGAEETEPTFWLFAPKTRGTRYFVGSAARRIIEAFGLITEEAWRRENGAFAP